MNLINKYAKYALKRKIIRSKEYLAQFHRMNLRHIVRNIISKLGQNTK